MSMFWKSAAAVMFIFGGAAAQATPITSDTLGPGQISFDPSTAPGSPTVSGNGITLSGGFNNGSVGGTDLSYYDSGGPLTISFASGVTGFGVDFLSNNVDISISAFDSSNNLLESNVFSFVGLPTAFGAPHGYAGFSGLSGISYAVLSTSLGGNSMYLGTVNVAGPVPEPASWAMMVGGFGLVGGAMRARKRAVVSFG